MEFAEIVRALLALGFVIGLILVCAWGARRAGFGAALAGTGSRQKRLALVDSLMLDARTRLLLVRRDGREHLLLLGASGATLLETAPAAAAPAAPAAKDAWPDSALNVVRMLTERAG